MKRMSILLAALLAIAGCSAVELRDPQIIMARNVEKGTGPSDITDKFPLESKVVAYIAFQWPETDSPAGQQAIDTKWFCNDKQISTTKFRGEINRPPFATWPSMPAAVLGVGKCHVDVFVKDKQVGTKSFEIVAKLPADTAK